MQNGCIDWAYVPNAESVDTPLLSVNVSPFSMGAMAVFEALVLLLLNLC